MNRRWTQGTDHALEFIVDTQWHDLPAGVRHQAGRCLLDLSSALIAGRRTPVGDIMADIACDQFPGDHATILVSGERVSAIGAALANGFAQNALDIDDGYRRVKGHPGAAFLPALLAALELKGGCTGAEFMTALVIGYEIGIRAGLIRHAVSPTYHSSGSWGAVAVAACTGRLLGLERVQLREALGTAEYHAPIAPMMKGIDVPCMGKDSLGWGNMTGLASVFMAKRGFTGVEPLFSEAPQKDWVTDLGRQYEILNLYFKPYAACRWAQPAVAGCLKLVKEYRLKLSDLARVRVRTFAAAAALTRKPPQNTEEAQYNLAFPVAAALIDGAVGPAQVLPPRLFNQDILDLAGRLEVEVAQEFEDRFPAKAIAAVEITTRDGKHFDSGAVEAPWEPPDTLPSDSELKEKFISLAGPVLGQPRSHKLLELIWQFEKADDARQLIRLSVVG
ncbi:MAG: MmgE/PrpD family protein [Hyphomicrobiales bacterium]